VDNGAPWGSSGDLPPELALWLIGSGVEMIWNPPRQPQKNGVIERSQGTGKRWSEPQRCATADELQQRIDEADRIQRDCYPSVGGRSRTATFPDLARSDPKAWRRREWSLTLVLEHLAEYVLVRRIDKVGKIGVYGRDLYVGKAVIGQNVFVTLDPIEKEWTVSTADGAPLRRCLADELNAADIRALALNRRGTRLAGKTVRPPTQAKLPGR
jgi:hypothetical protein